VSWRRRFRLVSIQQVSVRWRELFCKGNVTEETFSKAEKLLEALRPEDPLRHRLTQELEEIRRIHLQKKKAVRKLR
jgi:hypothetical protein